MSTEETSTPKVHPDPFHGLQPHHSSRVRNRARVLAELLPRDAAIVCELGVAAGEFADALLAASHDIAEYHGIDLWSDHHDTKEMEEARKRLSLRHRMIDKRFTEIILKRRSFADAVRDYSNDSFDLVYVDGYAHTGQEAGRTLYDWWPKVKPGGIFAGHDYDVAWPLTVSAVTQFVREHNLELNVIKGDEFASWWVRK